MVILETDQTGTAPHRVQASDIAVQELTVHGQLVRHDQKIHEGAAKDKTQRLLCF
jgi:hypothetical protein